MTGSSIATSTSGLALGTTLAAAEAEEDGFAAPDPEARGGDGYDLDDGATD
jgi:hypothetical protein